MKLHFAEHRKRLLATIMALSICIAGNPAASSPESITEAQRETPITHTADVVIVGGTTGGFGGCTAAIAAARQGANVIFIEETGSINPHTPLGLGVSFGNKGWEPTMEEGIYKEFARAIAETGQYAKQPMTYEQVIEEGELIMRHHDVIITAMLQLMQDAGVKMLFHTRFASVVMDGDRLSAIIVESPQGRHAVAGKVFIDSTGLGEVAFAAGAPMHREEPYLGLQAYIGGVDEPKYKQWIEANNEPLDESFKPWMETIVGPYDKLEHPWNQWWVEYINGRRMAPAVVRKLREAIDRGEFKLFRRHGEKAILAIPEGVKTDTGVARPRSYVTGIDPFNAEELSWAEVNSRIALMEYQRFFQKYIPGFENSVMEKMADQLSYRGGRWLARVPELSEAELQPKVKNADCVFLYRRHPEPDSIIEIPYRMFLPDKVEGLLVVGKASAGRELDGPRGVLFQGQAAGTAAALAARAGVTPREVNIPQLQSALKAAGVKIPY